MESQNNSMRVKIRFVSFVWFILLILITWIIAFIICWMFTFLDPAYVSLFMTVNPPFINSKQIVDHLKPVPSHIETKVADAFKIGMVKNINDLKVRDEGYKNHGFNALASRNIGEFRHIPDTRHKLCGEVVYPVSLPSASVVICFYNEHFETLVRTIHSIIRRTPHNLLHEIVLVDDFSDIPELYEQVDTYINNHSKIKEKVLLHKTEKREGLIRARIFGANLATGEVLVFLDSHVEVNKQWLEPLLSAIGTNRQGAVVTPIIDIINPDTFEYVSSPLVRGGFNWALHFKWENLPIGTLKTEEDFIKPIKSPTMAGGLFAIDRTYFNKLGQYDDGMDIWGGENLELSFRVWLCGGVLEIIPCSRIGHVFRKRRPYSSPNGEDTMIRNSLRVAHVWLDNYKNHFISERPETNRINYGDISKRVALRNELSCKPFSWYLENIYPELILPSDNKQQLKKKWDAVEKPVYQKWDERKRNYIQQFMMKLSNTSLCAVPEKGIKEKGSFIILKTCLRTKNQVWYQTDRHELIMGKLLCLETGGHGYKPKLSKCHELGGSQEWRYNFQNLKTKIRRHTRQTRGLQFGNLGSYCLLDCSMLNITHYKENTPIYNLAAGTCIGVKSANLNEYLFMKLCSDSSNINWDLIPIASMN